MSVVNDVHRTASVEIDRPPADVWRFLSDMRNDPFWCAAGDRVAIGVDPGRAIAWRSTAGPFSSGTRRIVGVDDTTCRVELTVHVSLTGIAPDERPAIAAAVEETFAADAARLRTVLAAPRQELTAL